MKKMLFSVALILAVALCLPMATPAAAGPIAGLAGLWHFNEGEGTIAINSSGNSDNGTLLPTGSEPVWVDGKIGKALSFASASGNYVEVLDNVVLNPGNVTVEAWVNLNSFASSPHIVGKGADAAGAYYLAVETTGEVRFNYTKSSDNWTWVGSGSNVLATDTWYHIAGTYDGANAKVYIDGVEAGTQEDAGLLNTSDTNNLYIGCGPNASSGFTDGIIDEVYIWNIALTGEQIALRSSGRVVWWPPVTHENFSLKQRSTLPLKFKLFTDNGMVKGRQPVFVTITGPEGFTPMTFQLGNGVSNLRCGARGSLYKANLKTKVGNWPTGLYTATVDGMAYGQIQFRVVEKGNRGRGKAK